MSLVWQGVKDAIMSWGRAIEREIRYEQNRRLNTLEVQYLMAINMLDGEESKEYMQQIKKELNGIYKERSMMKVKRMRKLEIENQVYDIQKLQREKRYESDKKIREIKIKDQIHSGTVNVVNSIQEEMEREMRARDWRKKEDPETEQEEELLNKIQSQTWTEDEEWELIKPITCEEIWQILNKEVDLDSSPGEDGITYRCIKHFMMNKKFEEMYVLFLNYTRDLGSYGCVGNNGIMVIKNKKSQSIEYDKKRKLTKLNKDTNLGHGKVWTNRLKKIILTKVLPKSQYNCQEDQNIINEVSEIRDINLHLLGGKTKYEKDGTILSIDFSNAFRSTSLRWFHLVMKRIGIPESFIRWFWTMYNELTVEIRVNGCRSEKIRVERGFMEGHPPSMAAFVLQMIPLTVALEEILNGIEVHEVTHKVKGFADDVKLFLGDLREVDKSYEIINKFEKVSGLEMHRDPTREKCQALPFGRHREHTEWPDWVTVKSEIKVVGIVYTNKQDKFEELNMDQVQNCFYMSLRNSAGIKGTLMQKVYCVNTYMFTKIWYTAQVVKLKKKKMDEMMKAAMNFIYAGENERPIRPLNFRPKQLGGLGLMDINVKAKSLLIKSMLRQRNKDQDIKSMYGYEDKLEGILEKCDSMTPVKVIYAEMVKEVYEKNGSVIPSRNEKKVRGIKWSNTWENLEKSKGLNAGEKEFLWKLSQDMLLIGGRIHRANVEKECKNINDGVECRDIPDLMHTFVTCKGIEKDFACLKNLIKEINEAEIHTKDILTISFTNRNRQRRTILVWFIAKVMFGMFKKENIRNTLEHIALELEWFLHGQVSIGSCMEMNRLRVIVGKGLEEMAGLDG